MLATAHVPAPGLDACAPLDQAAGLRQLLRRRSLRVLPVFGGTAVGRDAIAARLAHLAARSGSVFLLDQTEGDAIQAMGCQSRGELLDLLTGRLHMHDVAARIGSCRMIRARRGLASLEQAGASGEDFFRGFLRLDEPADLVVLNLADDTTELPAILGGRGDVLLTITPRPSALTAAYARIKQLCIRPDACARGIRVLVNGVLDEEEGGRIFGVLAATARQFLGVGLTLAGTLPFEAGRPPFGCLPGDVPSPSCGNALARIADSVGGWNLADFSLDDPPAGRPTLQ